MARVQQTQEFAIPVDSKMVKDHNGHDVTVLHIPYCQIDPAEADKLADMIRGMYDLEELDIEEVFEHIQSKSVARFVLNQMRPYVPPNKRATSHEND